MCIVDEMGQRLDDLEASIKAQGGQDSNKGGDTGGVTNAGDGAGKA